MASLVGAAAARVILDVDSPLRAQIDKLRNDSIPESGVTADVAARAWGKFTDTWWRRVGHDNGEEMFECAGALAASVSSFRPARAPARPGRKKRSK